MFRSQPLTQPHRRVAIDSTIGRTDWSKTKVVRPSAHYAVELRHYCHWIQRGCTPSGHFAYFPANAVHPLLRWISTKIGWSSFGAVASTKRVSKKVKLFFRHSTDPRLRVVYRQLQLRHHLPHRVQGLFRSGPTADDKIIGVVHDVRFPTRLVPELLPPEHKPAHIQIAEQWADRCSLWSTSTFVPIAHAPTLISTLIGFLNRSFQPHLDQMQHRSIDDPSSYRPHQFGMWNAIEVAAEIRIYNPPMASVD